MLDESFFYERIFNIILFFLNKMVFHQIHGTSGKIVQYSDSAGSEIQRFGNYLVSAKSDFKDSAEPSVHL